MPYLPYSYPHWIVQYGSNYPTALTAAFVDPDGGVVGTFNASQLSASSIDSGAVMMVTIALYQSSLSGVTVALNYSEHAGMLELAVG